MIAIWVFLYMTSDFDLLVHPLTKGGGCQLGWNLYEGNIRHHTVLLILYTQVYMCKKCIEMQLCVF